MHKKWYQSQTSQKKNVQRKKILQPKNKKGHKSTINFKIDSFQKFKTNILYF